MCVKLENIRYWNNNNSGSNNNKMFNEHVLRNHGPKPGKVEVLRTRKRRHNKPLCLVWFSYSI